MRACFLALTLASTCLIGSTAFALDISVGVEVPRHKVRLHRLPARIVKIVPAYESYEYFVLADGRIVIVDPDTYKIVVILS